jgi:hydroxymethylbilane synthase
MAKLILGTRGSKLALAQSEMIAAQLRAAHPGLDVALQIISTKGDRVLDVALSAVGDKGLFVKELEQALLDGSVDLCVHSCKDLPSQLPAGLTLAAFPERADARDVIVFNAKRQTQNAKSGEAADFAFFTLPFALPMGAVVGTSSLRRASQLRAARPDLVLRDVRGNVDTRLRKLAEGQYDALILAAAGLDRLNLVGTDGTISSDGATFAAQRIPTTAMLPAVAQGILAVECRADDARTVELLSVLDHAPSRAAALAERAFLRRLEGGCQVPIAAHAACSMQHAEMSTATIDLQGLVASLDGTTIVRGALSGPLADAETLGTALAEQLIAAGAEAILSALSTVTR